MVQTMVSTTKQHVNKEPQIPQHELTASSFMAWPADNAPLSAVRPALDLNEGRCWEPADAPGLAEGGVGIHRHTPQAGGPPGGVLVEPDFLGSLSVPVPGQPCVSLAQVSRHGHAVVEPKRPRQGSGSDTKGDPVAEEQAWRAPREEPTNG